MKLLTSFEVHVLTSDHRPGQVFRFAVTPPLKSYTPEIVDTLLAQLISTLDQAFPGNQFDIKKLSRRKYNIVPALIHNA